MTTTPGDTPQQTFAYTAQTFDGQPMTGAIDAASLEDAAQRLTGLRLRVIELAPALRPPRAKPLGREDFAAFNQQLAHLAAAGLPIEQGLRLIAEDLRNGRMARSVRNVLAELERGVPLGEAFRVHEKQFPPLYGTIIDAGIRAGNLPAVLLNVGRHLELTWRLRTAIWQSAAYPLMVLAGLMFVLVFLGHFVLPQFQDMYRKWGASLPAVTVAVLALARWTPAIIVLAIVLAIGAPLLWMILRSARLDRAAADLAIYLPLVGPILRRNLIARWCDAMKLAVQAGMDLPSAVTLACDVVGSPVLRRDDHKVIAHLNSGQSLERFSAQTSVLPRTVLAILQLSADQADLPHSLQTLATMYQQQAEMRVATVQTVLAPLLLLMAAAVIGFVVLGLFAPMISTLGLFS